VCSTNYATLLTFCCVIQIGVDGRASDNILEVEDHRFDVLLTHPTRILNVNQMSHVQSQLELGRKNSKNSLVGVAIYSFNLKIGEKIQSLKKKVVQKQPREFYAW
jgi:hypothetical protein